MELTQIKTRIFGYSKKSVCQYISEQNDLHAAEISAEGKSIFAHDPKGKVSTAYRALTQEVMKIEKQRKARKVDLGR